MSGQNTIADLLNLSCNDKKYTVIFDDGEGERSVFYDCSIQSQSHSHREVNIGFCFTLGEGHDSGSSQGDKKLNEASVAAAKALQDKWSIGGYSRFCDDAPDFEPASTEEIARVIESALSEVLSSKEPSGNSYVPEKPYGPNWNSVARDRFENGWLQKSTTAP